jgi:hypothetical protein
MTIVNYTSSIVYKLGASLTDDGRVIIYDRHMFIVQATDLSFSSIMYSKNFYWREWPSTVSLLQVNSITEYHFVA